MQNIIKKYSIYLILSLLILPWGVGYIFALDMGWGPEYPVSGIASNTWPLHMLITGLDAVVPAWLVQRCILILIIVLAGIGMHRLVAAGLKSPKSTAQYAALLPYLAGLLYICNPWFYIRLVNGQWLVLFGCALLPWAMLYLYRLLTHPSRRNAVLAGVWGGLIGLVSLHMIGIYVAVAVILMLVVGHKMLRSWWKWAFVAVGTFLIINSVWLVPALQGQSPAEVTISQVTDSQLDAFATKASIGDSALLSTLLLHGFWGDDTGRYVLSASSILWWWGVAIVMPLIGIGIWQIWRRHDRMGIALFIAGAVGWLLALGVGWSITEPLTRWLVEHVPYYAGYRDTQKWLILLIILYCYALVWGVAWLCERKHTRNTAAITIVGIAIALVGINLWGGLNGQLRASDYPRGWYDMQAELDRRDVRGSIVVLPWEMYIDTDFAGRTVSNPAKFFFHQPVVTGTHVGLAGVADVHRTALDSTISNEIMPMSSVITTTGSLLARHDVQFVMLMKQSDWRDYAWLDRQVDLKRAYENDSWILYEVTGAQR